MNPFWLIRMVRLVRNPPSWQTVLLITGVIVVGVIIVGFEQFWGWPDWLVVNNRFHGGRLGPTPIE